MAWYFGTTKLLIFGHWRFPVFFCFGRLPAPVHTAAGLHVVCPATCSRAGHRAVRLNSPWLLAAFARARVPRARARPCVGLPAGRLRRAEKHARRLRLITAPIPGALARAASRPRIKNIEQMINDWRFVLS